MISTTYALVDILNDGNDGILLFVLEKTVDVRVVDWIETFECISSAQSFQIDFGYIDAFRAEQDVAEIDTFIDYNY